MKHYTLHNGIPLHVIETDRFKSALMSVNLIVPVARETAAMNTLLMRVLKQGSAGYPSIAAINTRLDDLYAADLSTRNYKRGELQILGFAVDLLDGDYIPDDTDVQGGAADMLGELLLNPLLDADGHLTARIVEREKKSLCDAIRAKINNKQSYAQTRCTEEMCRNERFGLPLAGTIEEVEAITPAELTNRYHTLLREARVELFYVGHTDADQLIADLERALATYPAHTPVAAETEIIRTAIEPREIDEVQNVAQGKLVLGFRAGVAISDPDYIPMLVMCELYGGSPTSKLSLHVRERLSLCYYCSSFPDGYKGLMYVTSGIAAENLETALKEILAQLDAVRRGDFTAEELDNAIRSLESSYRKLEDRPYGLENHYLGRILWDISMSVEEMREAFRRVTAKEVIEAAQRISLDTVYFLHGDGNAEDNEEGEDDE